MTISQTDPSTKAVVESVRDLVSLEAHLIGQELQDALDGPGLHRLRQISAVLDQLAQVLEPRDSTRC